MSQRAPGPPADNEEERGDWESKLGALRNADVSLDVRAQRLMRSG